MSIAKKSMNAGKYTFYFPQFETLKQAETKLGAENSLKAINKALETICYDRATANLNPKDGIKYTEEQAENFSFDLLYKQGRRCQTPEEKATNLLKNLQKKAKSFEEFQALKKALLDSLK